MEQSCRISNHIYPNNLKVIKFEPKEQVKYKKDGTPKLTHSNKQTGVSSKVYPMTDEEIQQIKDYLYDQITIAETDEKQFFALRNYTMFVVGLNTGLRESDLVVLRFDHFMFDFNTFQPCIRIFMKKTHKWIEIAMNEEIKDTIRFYLDYSQLLGYHFDNKKYLFPSRQRPHIGAARWHDVMKQICTEVGIKRNIATHSLRKTYAEKFIENNFDNPKAILGLKNRLGHSTIESTMHYMSSYMNDKFKEVKY